MGRISAMAFSWSWFTDNSFVPNYTICMIEILEIFWASPIELRVIIVGTPIVFILLAYLGISGTNQAIDFQNRLWRDEEWRKKNK